MESGEFVDWLAGIGRLTPAQRGQAAKALCKAEEADEDAASGSGGPVEATARGSEHAPAALADRYARKERGVREDALGDIGQAKVERQGCPHCAGRDVVAFGRANGLARYRCKSCGRTFNALTKTAMAGLRKKEQWLDHAQAMIEATSVAKAAERCHVHPTTAFRWRHRFLGSPALDKPKTLTGLVEADETFILELFKGRRSDLSRRRASEAARRSTPACSSRTFPFSSRATASADHRRGVAQCRPRLDRGGAQRGGHARHRFVCDGGKAIVAFARRANIPVHVVRAPGKPRPEAPDLHLNNVNAYHGRLKEWIARFHGVATENLPYYLGWRRALEAWGDRATPQNWILGAMESGPINSRTL